MNGYLDLLNALKTELTNNALIKSVTFGSIDEVELKKKEIYPLAHVGINAGSIGSSSTDLNVSILFLDVVDDEKDVDTFEQHEVFVVNNMLASATKTVQELLRGNMYRDGYQVEDDASLEIFADRFEDKLAGVAVDFTVSVKSIVTLC